MPRRLELQTRLERLLESDYVYFQPPANVEMEYPCIVYRRNSVKTKFANDFPYVAEVRYQVTVIDPDPDSLIPGKIAALPKCSFDRHYTVDNLNHDVYNLYF